jgi:hypothetical protein
VEFLSFLSIDIPLFVETYLYDFYAKTSPKISSPYHQARVSWAIKSMKQTVEQKLIKHILKELKTLYKMLPIMNEQDIQSDGTSFEGTPVETIPESVPEAQLEASEAIPAEDLSIENPESLEENTTAPIE